MRNMSRPFGRPACRVRIMKKWELTVIRSSEGRIGPGFIRLHSD